MDLAKVLANNLKARRGRMTQTAFARKLGISQATLAQLERANQNMTLKTLSIIVKSLRCSVCDLFSEKPRS